MYQIQEDDGPIYRTRVGDNSLMDINSIINIIHNRISNIQTKIYKTKKKVQPGELNQRVKQIPVFPLNHKTKTFLKLILFTIAPPN